MVGWHHRLNGHEFEQASGVGDGQGGLVCCSSWGHKESDTTEGLNQTEQFFPGLFTGVIYLVPYFEYSLKQIIPLKKYIVVYTHIHTYIK